MLPRVIAEEMAFVERVAGRRRASVIIPAGAIRPRSRSRLIAQAEGVAEVRQEAKEKGIALG